MKKDIKLLIESIFDNDDIGVDVLGLDNEEYDITDKVIDYVDLGLPSGTKWCKYNVGANKETEYGDYYQWGETKGNVIEMVDEDEYAKYNRDDELELLLPEDDIAYQTSKGFYRMPTKKQIKELTEYTHNEWVRNFKDSGVNGLVFRSMMNNNNYIFIPAAGFHNPDESIRNQGSEGCLWGSSRCTSSESHCLSFDSLEHIYAIKVGYRYKSFPVRGVLNEK